MSVRTSIELTVQAGRENDLDKAIIDTSFQELLDTLDHGITQTGELAGAEAGVVVDKGDITQIRLIYIEANGELDVFLGGVAATAATLLGVAASYPTGFTGGEILDIDIDGVNVVVTFLAGDTALATIINRINAAAAFAGLSGLVASDVAGQVQLDSLTTGTGSVITVNASTAAVPLGFAAAQTDQGKDATPDQSPMSLQRQGDINDASAVASLKAYLLATVVTDKLTITNPSATAAVRYTIFMGGDLVDPPADC